VAQQNNSITAFISPLFKDNSGYNVIKDDKPQMETGRDVL